MGQNKVTLVYKVEKEQRTETIRPAPAAPMKRRGSEIVRKPSPSLSSWSLTYNLMGNMKPDRLRAGPDDECDSKEGGKNQR